MLIFYLSLLAVRPRGRQETLYEAVTRRAEQHLRDLAALREEASGTFLP